MRKSWGMRTHPVVWALRVCWLTLPFTAGDAIGAALDARSTPVTLVVGVIAWATWAAGLIASLVAHPVALTVIRIVVPTAPVAAVAALTVWAPDGATASDSVLGFVGLGVALVATAAAMSGATADEYVDGASYGAERRFALRVPTTFLLGPIPVFWAVLVAGCVGGPMLLAARQWVAGAALAALGAVVALPAVRAFHGLSKRWIVFVPAGATLIDHLSLVDPVLFPTRRIAAFGPALDGTTATDLTQGALGLVVEVGFDSPVEITARTSKAAGEVQLVRAVLVSPSRPGAVVTEAMARGLQGSDAAAASPPPTTSSPS